MTTAPLVSAWTVNTLEQERIQSELLRLGVGLHTQSRLTAIKDGAAEVDHAGTGDHTTFACDAVVLITDRLPNDGLFQSLRPHFADATQTSLKVIGDAEAPNIIAQAVYAGYLAAVEFDEVPPAGTPFRLERNAA